MLELATSLTAREKRLKGTVASGAGWRVAATACDFLTGVHLHTPLLTIESRLLHRSIPPLLYCSSASHETCWCQLHVSSGCSVTPVRAIAFVLGSLVLVKDMTDDAPMLTLSDDSVRLGWHHTHAGLAVGAGSAKAAALAISNDWKLARDAGILLRRMCNQQLATDPQVCQFASQPMWPVAPPPLQRQSEDSLAILAEVVLAWV